MSKVGHARCVCQTCGYVRKTADRTAFSVFNRAKNLIKSFDGKMHKISRIRT